MRGPRQAWPLSALLALVACRSLPEPADPLAPARATTIATPVLDLAWKRIVHDRSMDNLPQELATPVATREAVYVGSHAGVFLALRPADGKVLWQRELGPVSSTPLLAGSRIYVGSDDGALVALDAHDGQVRWRHAGKGAVLQPPVLAGELVLFASDADRVIALERETGKWRWQYERETPEEFTMRGHAGVTVVDDRVFAGFSDGHLVALTLAGGEVSWVRSLAGEAKQFMDVDSTPVVDRGVLYAASTSSGLYALDPSDGTERWHVGMHGAGMISLDVGAIYVAAADEGLMAIDLTGHVLWRQGLRGAGDPGKPIISDKYLFISMAERGMAVVDKASGALLQSFEPGPGVSSDPTLEADSLYVMSNGGILYAMSVARL